MTSPSRRGLLAACGAAVLTAVLGVAVSANAAEYTPLTDRYMKTVALKCDPSACYYTWGALDNDKDGVTNADERAAGTDPDDPKSHPGLGEIVELATHRGLPSFEAGMGSFTLTPADVLMAREKAGFDLNNTAFPVLDRKDALTRMGISGALLAEYGIKLDKDGLSIGLGTGRDKNGLVLPTVGTIASTWHAGGRGGQKPNSGLANGGVLRTVPDAGNRRVTYEYNDGSSKTVEQTGPGTSRHDYFDQNGNLVVRENHKEWSEQRNGATDAHDEYVARDEAGNVVAKVVKDTHHSTDGSTSTHTSTTTHFSNGDQVVAVWKSESTSIGDSEGGSTESTSRQTCDSSGNHCTPYQKESGSEEGDYPPASDDGSAAAYWDPENAMAAFVTQEAIGSALTMRGAAVTTRQNWTPPGYGGQPKSVRDPALIALFDSDSPLSGFMMTDPLRVTKAQPEIRQGMPDPITGDPHTPGPCQGLC